MHHEESYQQMIEHFEEYNDVAGDHPLNLGSTTQVFNAFAVTGEQKYFDHIVDYVGAWQERCDTKPPFIPSCSMAVLKSPLGFVQHRGKRRRDPLEHWPGRHHRRRGRGAVVGRRLRLGTPRMSSLIAMASAQPDRFGCGQGFNCVVPQTGERVWRSAFGTHAAMGFGNAILLTGDVEKYASTWRGVLDAVNANSKEENGQTLYPHVYGAFTGSGDEPKWDQYTAVPYNQGADELFFWTQNPADLTWAGESRWRDFLAGGDAGYPVDRLSDTLERLRDLVDEMRHREFTNPTTRLSDVKQPRPRFRRSGFALSTLCPPFLWL